MHIGTQFRARSDSDYEVFAQLGVNHICGYPPGNYTEWTESHLSRYREKVESYGVALDLIPLPLNSAPLDRQLAEGDCVNIMLGKSPERDHEIEQISNIIGACAQAGIPAVKYNLNIIGIPRTEPIRGRGGSTNSSFRWTEAHQDEPPTMAGCVSTDEFWDRINYFLERVVPVANEYKVRMALHPHDPYTPPGYRGVTRVLGTVDGLKQVVRMHESPYHGLNFCQGTISEMLDNPSEEIYDVIRFFGERGKIFNVHFRNIKGGKLDFAEVFPDEGVVDMLKAARVYRDVGYSHMLMPDHTPQISGENEQGVGFAYAYGYIRGLVQAVEAGE